jgi:hypothetical protein
MIFLAIVDSACAFTKGLAKPISRESIPGVDRRRWPLKHLLRQASGTEVGWTEIYESVIPGCGPQKRDQVIESVDRRETIAKC